MLGWIGPAFAWSKDPYSFPVGLLIEWVREEKKACAVRSKFENGTGIGNLECVIDITNFYVSQNMASFHIWM